MFLKTLCLLLALAVAYGRPYVKYDSIDPGFSHHPNQGHGPDPSFGNSHGQGGFPSQGGFVPGYPNTDEHNYYGAGGSHSGHRHGYQEHGY